MKIQQEEKQEIPVVGVSRTFAPDTCQKEIPLFWQQFSSLAPGIRGIYGICRIEQDSVTYMIADPSAGQSGAFAEMVLPGGRWLVCSDEGPLPHSIQHTEEQLEQWLAEHPQIETDGSLMVEYYSDPCAYEKGGQDEKYAYQVWKKLKQG